MTLNPNSEARSGTSCVHQHCTCLQPELGRRFGTVDLVEFAAAAAGATHTAAVAFSVASNISNLLLNSVTLRQWRIPDRALFLSSSDVSCATVLGRLLRNGRGTTGLGKFADQEMHVLLNLHEGCLGGLRHFVPVEVRSRGNPRKLWTNLTEAP